MKTNELVKRVKALGYEVKWHKNSFGKCLYILNKEEDTVARVNSQYRYDFGTSQNFYLETEKNQGELFGLMIEYAKTPVNERIEQKKYRLLPKLEDLALGKYPLQRMRSNGAIFLSCDYENYELFQEIFTDTDIKKMPTWVSEFIEQGYLIKEEIKDDNEI